MKSLRFLVITGMLCLFGSCYYDEPPQPVPIDPDLVFFSSSIVPILDRSCNNPGCHSAADDDPAPDLTAANAYDQLLGGGYVNTTLPESSTLYLRVTGTSAGPLMPPGGRMSPTDLELILIWIKKGALND
ncbi:MAG: hypothetical protein ACR2MX_12155, partial [Cyclobacteriaceae bacterium]